MGGKSTKETDEHAKPESLSEAESKQASRRILEEVTPAMPTQRRLTGELAGSENSKSSTEMPIIVGKKADEIAFESGRHAAESSVIVNEKARANDIAGDRKAETAAKTAGFDSKPESLPVREALPLDLDKDGSKRSGVDAPRSYSDNGADRVTDKFKKASDQKSADTRPVGILGDKAAEAIEGSSKAQADRANSKDWEGVKIASSEVQRLEKSKELSKFGIEENPGQLRDRGMPSGQPASKPRISPEIGAGERTGKDAPTRTTIPVSEPGGGGLEALRGPSPGLVHENMPRGGGRNEIPPSAPQRENKSGGQEIPPLSPPKRSSDGGHEISPSAPQRGNLGGGSEFGGGPGKPNQGQLGSRGHETDSLRPSGQGRSPEQVISREPGSGSPSRVPEQGKELGRPNREVNLGQERTSSHGDVAPKEASLRRQSEHREVEAQHRGGPNQTDAARSAQLSMESKDSLRQRTIQSGSSENNAIVGHSSKGKDADNVSFLRHSAGTGPEGKETKGDHAARLVQPVAKGGLEKVASDKDVQIMSLQSQGRGTRSGDKGADSNPLALEKPTFKIMHSSDVNQNKGSAGDLLKSVTKLEGQISHIAITADVSGSKNIGPIGKVDPGRASVEHAATVKALVPGHPAEAGQVNSKGHEAVRVGKDNQGIQAVKPTPEVQSSQGKQVSISTDITGGVKPIRATAETSGQQGHSVRAANDSLTQGQRTSKMTGDTASKTDPSDRRTTPGDRGVLSDSTHTGHHSAKREFTGAEIALAALIAAAGTARVRPDQADDLRVKRPQADGKIFLQDQPASRGQEIGVGRIDATKDIIERAESSSKGQSSKADTSKEPAGKQEIQKGQTGQPADQIKWDGQGEFTQDDVDENTEGEKVNAIDELPEQLTDAPTGDDNASVMPGLLEQLHIPGQAIGLEKRVKEGEDAEEEVLEGAESDDTNSKSASQTVMLRPTCLISQRDTLVSLAEELFHDANLAWLIADLNKGQLKDSWEDGKRIVEARNRQEIVLPVWQDIVEFYENKPSGSSPENLITIVVETQIDRELLDSTLGIVMGGTPASEKSSSVAGAKGKPSILKPVLSKAAGLLNYALPDLNLMSGATEEGKEKKKSRTEKSAPPLSP